MARNFDGTNDRISTADAAFDFERTASWSISFWIRPSASGILEIVSKMDSPDLGYEVLRQSDDTIHIQLIAAGGNAIQVRSTNTVANNIWSHIVATYNGSSLASGALVYINKVLETMVVNSDTLTQTILNNVNLTIGARPGNTLNFTGRIAQVAIHDAVLSQSQTDESFSRGYTIHNLKGLWPLWGLASPEPDLSGLRNNGTVTETTKADHAPVGRYTPKRTMPSLLSVTGPSPVIQSRISISQP